METLTLGRRRGQLAQPNVDPSPNTKSPTPGHNATDAKLVLQAVTLVSPVAPSATPVHAGYL